MSGRGPLRVLGLVTEAYGGTGGIAQYNRDFWDALARAPGIATLDLLPRRGCGRTGDTRGESPARLRLHPPRPGRAAYAAAAFRLARQVRPDIVVCGHLFMVALAAAMARLVGARLAVQLHGIEIWREPGALRRRALERADLVLCVSRDTRARVLAAAGLPPERVLVLPNTVAEDCTPGPRGPDGRGSRILLSVGRLDAREAYKGHDAVIACLPALRARGYDLLYRVAGEGDDRPRLERLARECGVAERVRFLGAVPRAALPDLYRAADLFVLPSRGEGFGIVYLEAMACGTPALGLAEGGAVDALDGLGRAVPMAALADTIADELDRTGGRSEAARHALAEGVRARFGRPLFEEGVARAVARLAAPAPGFSHPGAAS